MKYRRKTQTEGRRRRYFPSEDPVKFEAALNLFRSKILTSEAITGGKNGYYTWILKDTPLLAAARTRSEQELGTLHANLDALTPPGRIVAAGEFMKDGANIVFNLQSGSFMKAVFSKIKANADKAAMRDSLIDTMKGEFARIGLTAVFIVPAAADAPIEEQLAGQPMIDKAEIITTLSDIAEYDRVLSISDEK